MKKRGPNSRKGEKRSLTEWEKLCSGRLYNDFDEDLNRRRGLAKRCFRAYNRTQDEDVPERQRLMRQLFGAVGEDVWIEPDFRCEYGCNIRLGSHIYINFGALILDCAEITVGDHTLIGPNLGIFAADHALDAEERIHGACSGKPVHIGKNVWLGGDVKILGGVDIGDNTVIGAGSVVTKSIPANVIAVGSPCRVLRPITEKDKTGYTW